MLCDIERDAHTADLNSMSYKVMFQMAATQLSLGINTVVDCPMARVTLYEQAITLAAQFGAQIVLVECRPQCTASWRQRLETRGAAIAASCQAHKPCSWEALQKLLDGYKECWRWSEDPAVDIPHHVVLDTTKGEPQQHADAVLSYLAERGLLNRAAAVEAKPAAVDAATC